MFFLQHYHLLLWLHLILTHPKQHGNSEGETFFACVKQDSYTCG